MSNYMENCLDMPLREVLKLVQNRMIEKTSYFGVKALQNPFDFWVYQEIVSETRPDVILEIGNNCGGSTLALAHLCDLLGHGRVIGLDISHEQIHDTVKKHSRITLIEGDACASFEKVREVIRCDERVLVIEDSSHTYENTRNALKIYSKFVKPGGYFIVEDSICHHGLDVGPSPGPYEAIDDFVKNNSSFVVDREKESFFITWNPKGYLKKIK